MRTDYLPYLLALALLSLLHVSAAAAESRAQPAGNAALSAEHGVSPAALIEDTVEQLLVRLNDDAVATAERSERLYELVKDLVVPHLDMPRIAHIVLGKYARRVDGANLETFTGEFQTLLVRTYTSSLMAYQGERVDVSQAAAVSARGTATVDLRVYRADGAPIEISFLTHNRRGPWLVYDIRIEGISLVGNYRSEFSSILRNQGVEGLINSLKNRNRQSQLTAQR
jgi:phospholipid transport system substrate-binding protein